MKPWLPAFVLMTVPVLGAMATVGFRPPDGKQRQSAIGPVSGLPATMQRALDPAVGFAPIPAPKSNDWLANHPEDGQTFGQFAASRPNLPKDQRKKIYLLPLGGFSTGRSPLLETLREYAALYFGLETKLLPAVPIGREIATSRINPFTKNRQLLTSDILRWLVKILPDDAFCLLALTMDDLYPDPAWNFVFGQATFEKRVGVYSLARYDPAFYGQKRDRDTDRLILLRSLRILVHETGHMFGIHHCIHFHCLMNGCNHLDESDAAPIHLCPVCLRKLQWSVGFDVLQREQKLLTFYEKVGFKDEAAWTAQRVKWIAAPSR